MKNKAWLRYSQHIAMMRLDRMEELHMSQKQLSELIGCSQQYISKVLKGHENLSLETISKIESCLNQQIMPTNPYRYTDASDTEEEGANMVAEDVVEYKY